MKDHYRRTWFESASVPLADAFAIITAHNPFGEIYSSEKNVQADQKLAQDLREMGLEPFRVIGYSEDRSHAEAGWGVVIPLEKAIEIGRVCEQDAIFWVEQGTLHLVCLKTLAREAVCPWQERLQSLAIPYFTIHLGSSPPDYAFSKEDESMLQEQVLKFFKGFTLQRARGCFLGAEEEVMLISIATHDVGMLLKLAATLRRNGQQKGVGIHVYGHYFRVTEVSDLELLQEELLRLASFSRPPL